MESLSELIKSLRYRLDLTQPQLAERIGVNESTVRHWENGDKLIGPSGLMTLLHLADQSGDKQFGTGVTKWQSSEMSKRVEKIRSRKGDIRPTMKALIRTLKKSAESADSLTADAANSAPAHGDLLATRFSGLAISLRNEATNLEALYEIINEVVINDKACLKRAVRQHR